MGNKIVHVLKNGAKVTSGYLFYLFINSVEENIGTRVRALVDNFRFVLQSLWSGKHDFSFKKEWKLDLDPLFDMCS